MASAHAFESLHQSFLASAASSRGTLSGGCFPQVFHRYRTEVLVFAASVKSNAFISSFLLGHYPTLHTEIDIGQGLVSKTEATQYILN